MLVILLFQAFVAQDQVLDPSGAETEDREQLASAGEEIQLAPASEPIPGYVLQRRIAAGGFGEVWEASGPSDFPVAMKFVRLDAKGQVELKALRIAKKARHPHLVTTHGAWQRPGYLIIAMELADHSLFDRLQETISEGSTGIPQPELLGYMQDAATGIDYLNQPKDGSPGVQHRDIKPQNLLVVGGHVKVADFGIARVVHGAATGHTGRLSLSYAAPEFFDGQTSDRSDQYGLAVTYCHLLTGDLPFVGTDVEIMRGHIEREPDLSRLPESDHAVVARAMSKSPADRWPSCGEFVADLRNSYTGAGTTEAKRGSRHVLVLAGLLLAITAVAGTLAWQPWARTDRETVTVAEQSAPAGDSASNRLSPLGNTFDSLSSFAPDATTVGLVGRTEYGDAFKDVSPDGSLIVGLRLTTGGFGVK